MRLSRAFAVAMLIFLVALAAFAAGPYKIYPYRWLYMSTRLETDAELARVEGIVTTAAAHGLNGMVLSAGFDSMDLKSPDKLERLTHLKQTCDRLKLEIIPLDFSVGYGSGITDHDPNLAAGLPVHGALYVATPQEAHFVPESPKLLNAGFEERNGDLPANYTLHGAHAVIDTNIFHSGKASVRFEDFAASQGSVYLQQTVKVTPYRSYRLRCWVKTENIAPHAIFHLWARAPDGRDLAYMEPHLPATTDWRELIWHFNSWYADQVDFRIGISEGEAGKVWVDDVKIEETGLVNVLRRSGTPVVVKNEKTGEIYEEGRDFAPISDPHINFLWDHDGPNITLLPGSRIHSGDRLRVDYFHGTTIYSEQVPDDMSEPGVYAIWQKQLPLVEKYVAPKKYFLSMDEVRVGGFCNVCKGRHISMAQMLGETVTRQIQMIHAVNPNAEVWTWSDMFDPNHNAKERYYLIDGSFKDSANYLPKDVSIACWWYSKRDLSLPFFSKLGYRTLGAAYYDADDLNNSRGWLQSLDQTPGAQGIMYTTWSNKYALLADFGDLVSGK